MKRKMFLGLICLLVSYGLAAAETVKMRATPKTLLEKVEGTNEVSIAPGYYPNFYDFSSDNPTCGNYLKTPFDGKVDANNAAINGLSNAPLWVKSKYGTGAPLKTKAEVENYQALSTPLKLTLTVPEQDRTTSMVQIIWMIRAEGVRPDTSVLPAGVLLEDGFKVWPLLCKGWHGTSMQSFSAGKFYSAIFVNNSQKSIDVTMDIPDADIKAKVTNIHDPTTRGSCTLSPGDFADGKLPAVMEIELKWKNDTGLKVYSPENGRMLEAELRPLATDVK